VVNKDYHYNNYVQVMWPVMYSEGYLTNSTGNSLSRAVACVSTKDVHSYARLRSANNINNNITR